MAGPATPVELIGTVLGIPKRVTVDSTVGGKTLSQLGVTIDPSVRELALIPEASGIYWADGGPASVSSLWLGSGGLVLPYERARAELLQFYAAVTTDMMVIQAG